MKIIMLFASITCLSTPAAMANSFGSADATSYIITLEKDLDDRELDACVEKICKLSGNREIMECEIVSKRARIAAANLSNAAARKVGGLSCVTSLRAERFDFEPRPRGGRSN